jgi:hypothetical protein
MREMGGLGEGVDPAPQQAIGEALVDRFGGFSTPSCQSVTSPATISAAAALNSTASR